eukprot:GHUV01010853.1.p4 GENE.GHUV01010853.1~~GHUV01010853.1.p4  ORF type:complete len:112 (+),score=20.05 GHUV01010853.1:135-470(+)
MLIPKQLCSSKVVGQARHANNVFQRAAPNSRAMGGLQPCSSVSRLQFSAVETLRCGTVSGKRARVAAANAETATAVTTVETGLLELNQDTFHDFINSAGDSVVVVDFFTDW